MNHSPVNQFDPARPEAWSSQSDGPFLLRGRRPLYAPRLAERLTPGALDTLAARSHATFSKMDGAAGEKILVGSIPYDRSAEDAIYRPRWVEEVFPAGLAASNAQHWAVQGLPTAEGYAKAVAQALTRLGPDLPKVVLSRSLNLRGETPVNLGALLARLTKDPAVAAFVTPLPPVAGTPRHMVGASPELLVSRRGRRVESNPLAGSLPRARAATAGEAAKAMLSGADKDRREHALVVEAVADALSPFCAELSVPPLPSVQSTQSMWHLGTRISGQLKEDTPVAALVAALHPTPAICGAPRTAADALLRALEGYDRGFYAGAVGWMDERGDGDWYITLRCAETCGNSVRLFAGAGIVEGSDPNCEVIETSAKFLAMLSALGVDETGAPLKDSRV